MDYNKSGSSQFKSFVSEAELEERKKRRQEEWEKVRRPDQPLECPEEEYDPKSLYERLKEQKDKKQAEYEEAHRLKNLIKGLDDDEVAFLELVDKTKIEMESKRLKEDLEEIQEYRKAVANLSEEAEDVKLKEFKKSVGNLSNMTSAKKQSNLIKAVKRKSVNNESSAKRSKIDETDKNKCIERATTSIRKENDDSNENRYLEDPENLDTASHYLITSSLQCMGVLPGLGIYSDSSDSDNSSSSDIDQDRVSYDLVGRQLLGIQLSRSSQQHL